MARLIADLIAGIERTEAGPDVGCVVGRSALRDKAETLGVSLRTEQAFEPPGTVGTRQRRIHAKDDQAIQTAAAWQCIRDAKPHPDILGSLEVDQPA